MKFSKKIFIYLFIATGLITIGMSVITHHWIVDQHKKVILSSSRELVRLAAMKSEDYILRGETVELHGFLKSILAVGPYINYLFVMRNDTVLVHTFDNGVPRGLLSLPRLSDSDDVDILPVEDTQGLLIYHLRINIGSPWHSVLHMGISGGKIQDELNEHRKILMVIGLILLGIIPLGMAMILSRFASRPITLLREGVERIGKGELDYRLDLPTGDEIEELARDINTMAGNFETLREGLTKEIAERMQARDDLARQSDLLNTILMNIPQYVFWKDRNCVYLGCNKAFSSAAGMSSPEQVAGKTDFDMPWSGERAKVYRALDRAVMEEGAVVENTEEIFVRADGRQETVIITLVPLKTSTGDIFGVMGLFVDITERKQMEESIKQSQKMEAIGTLAGGIAHDFNNILGSIIGFTELAEYEAGPESPLNPHLTQVLASACRARDLVRQILTFSRKNQEERRPITLASVVEEEVKLLSATLPATIEIVQRIDDTDGQINADPTQLHQVVMNLCTNAAQAMAGTGGCITIALSRLCVEQCDLGRTFHGVPPGTFMKLSVSDTGPGIDKKHLHRIFEPFFTTKAKEMGTGMGLSVVHGIVKELGGDILVKSLGGRGTTFTVILPRVSLAVASETAGQLEAPRGRGCILFVDDEAPLRALGERMLGSLGYHVTVAGSSLEALNVYQASPEFFDLVLTDQTMPHMTGYDLSLQILKINPSARILLCTGFSETITPEKVTDAGISGLLYKPVSRDEMARTVRDILNSSPAYSDGRPGLL